MILRLPLQHVLQAPQSKHPPPTGCYGRVQHCWAGYCGYSVSTIALPCLALQHGSPEGFIHNNAGFSVVPAVQQEQQQRDESSLGCNSRKCTNFVHVWQLKTHMCVSRHTSHLHPIIVHRSTHPRLCKPPLNPLSHDVRLGILDGLNRAQHDDSVSLIVITGGNKAFSAGADIKEMADAHAVRRSPDLLTVVGAIEASAVPVVAAIGGVALGGGCEVRPVRLYFRSMIHPYKYLYDFWARRICLDHRHTMPWLFSVIPSDLICPPRRLERHKGQAYLFSCDVLMFCLSRQLRRNYTLGLNRAFAAESARPSTSNFPDLSR